MQPRKGGLRAAVFLIVRAAHAEHGRRNSAVEIAGGEAAAREDLRKFPLLLRCRAPPLVEQAAVNLRHAEDVFRRLHAPLDLERFRPGGKQLGNAACHRQVFQTERIIPAFVGQPAGLRAHAAVAAAPAHHAAEQALPAVADAERAVDEGLDLDRRRFAERGEIFARQLARGDHACKAVCREKPRRVGIVPRKLGAGVQRHGRDLLPDQRRRAHIGNDQRVHARLFEKGGVGKHVPHLAVKHQRVERHITLHAEGAAELCRRGDLVPAEILCKGARAEVLAAEVDRIRTRFDRRLQRGKAARRGEQLGKVVPHLRRRASSVSTRAVSLSFSSFMRARFAV